MTQPTAPESASQGRLLLVDDNSIILTATARILRAAKFEVMTASDGQLAFTLLRQYPFEAVFSDVSMPTMDGLQLLREVHAKDPHMPVVLMTGGPSMQAAITALEHGALRYLLKPVDPDQLTQIAREAVLQYRLAESKREALKVLGYGDQPAADLTDAQTRLARAESTLQLWYEPVVSVRGKACVGFEVLCRSDEPTLNDWASLCAAAERAGRLDQLGRCVRQAIATAGEHAPGATFLLVPLHPKQLFDDALTAADCPLRSIATRTVFCLPDQQPGERAAEVPERVERLRKMGFRIALADVGAGSAGLSGFGQLSYEMARLSPLFADSIATSGVKQKVLRSLVGLHQELRIPVIAAGIRTIADREMLGEMGVDLMQGPYFAPASRTFARAQVRTA